MMAPGLMCRSPPRYEGKHLLKKIVTLNLADFWPFFGRVEFQNIEYILVVDHNILVEASAKCCSS